MHRMHRVAPSALLLGVALLLLAAPARADVLASPCDVDHFARYLGERCLMCEASEYEPERCREAYAAAGLRQRCSGSPLGTTRGSSIWGELWCLPPEQKDSALPAELPLIERVADPSDRGIAGLPPIPEGFRDTQPLPAEEPGIDAEASDRHEAPASPSAPAAAVPAKTTKPPTAGCSGCAVAGEVPAASLVGVLVVFGRRRRAPRPRA